MGIRKLISNKYIYLIPITLWCITLIYRVPFVKDEVPTYNAGHIFMLTTLEIWQDEHPAISNYAMKQTYSNEGDKHITYYKRYMDESGNNYYVSHLTLALNLANTLIKLKVIPLSNAGLQWITLFLHILSLIVLTNFILLLTEKHESRFLILLTTLSIYTFHHAIINLHTLHYFAESLGQFMFVVMLRQTYIYFFKKEYTKPVDVFLLGLWSFLFVSAEWLGICFILATILYFGLKFKQIKKIRDGIVSMIIGGFLAMFVFIYQHASLNNISSFVDALKIRFIERSGFFGEQYTDMGYSYSNLSSFELLLDKFWMLLSGIGIIGLFAALIYLFVFKKIRTYKQSHTQAIIVISALSCVIYLVMLFSATITHYIYITKWVLPLSIFTGYVIWLFYTHLKLNIKKKFLSFFLLIIIASIWSADIFIAKAKKDLIYTPELKEFAKELKKHIAKDESLCMIELKDYPYSSVIYISYCLKRNIAYVSSIEEAKLLFDKTNKQNGVVVQTYFDENKKNIKILRIENPNHLNLFY